MAKKNKKEFGSNTYRIRGRERRQEEGAGGKHRRQAQKTGREDRRHEQQAGRAGATCLSHTREYSTYVESNKVPVERG